MVLLPVFIFLLLMAPALARSAQAASDPAPSVSQDAPKDSKSSPGIAISGEIGESMVREAARVKNQFQEKARSLFRREPLGWNMGTIHYLYQWGLSLPLKIPAFIQAVLEQSRVLGAAGSIIILIFLVAVLYSVLGRKRIMARIEAGVAPYRSKLPEGVYPFVLSALRVIIAALFPLVLLGIYSLINAMIAYRAAWFVLTGRVLVLWAVGALVIGLLRETLTSGLFKVTAQYGGTVFQLTRLAVFYAMVGVALVWGAESFSLRPDVLALLKFAISISIVLVLFLLNLKKRAILSLVPQLPYRSYQSFVRMLESAYFPFIFFSLLMALLWCVGYRQLGRLVLVKTWSTVAAYLVIMGVYHFLLGWLGRWHGRTASTDETAQFLYRSFKGLLVYATVLATAMVVLNLMGLLGPLQQAMSFPVFKIGEKWITFWIVVKAGLILLAFIFASRLIQAYCDYKVYPRLGIDPGLGYALNTFFKYTSLAVGFLISMKVVGIDLRLLLVFAGAAGIGIGLGLQNLAANVISGFSLIFGGKIRKGDWIEVSGTMGIVTDIHLRATQIRTRDHVDYLVPNANFISGTIVNYSLSSPYIRTELPVGVSYDADPHEVEEILLKVAGADPLVERYRPPVVRFVAFADSSINFELLFWIDVRKTPRRKVRSSLYFTIFDELKKAGIEIPFPQRDVHMR
jgi:small-conductance mechanosensitive channel